MSNLKVMNLDADNSISELTIKEARQVSGGLETTTILIDKKTGVYLGVSVVFDGKDDVVVKRVER